MKIANKKIFWWKLGGAILTVLLGSLLHFAYELSGSWRPMALFGAVNESTWEHLKIGFWPALLFGIVEYFIYGKKNENFLLGKLINLYTIPVGIILFFYGYLLVIKDSLFMDILIFIIAIAIAHWLDYKIVVNKRSLAGFEVSAIALILLLTLAFSLFSYFPLTYFIFLDPVSGGYGIVE